MKGQFTKKKKKQLSQKWIYSQISHSGSAKALNAKNKTERNANLIGELPALQQRKKKKHPQKWPTPAAVTFKGKY